MKKDRRGRAADAPGEQDDFVALLDAINHLYKQGTFENPLPVTPRRRGKRLPLEKRSDLFALTQRLKRLLAEDAERAGKQNPLRYYEGRAIIVEIYDYFNK